MAGKPELTKGFLGAQPKFAEFGLGAVSHVEAEINTNSNQVWAFTILLKFILSDYYINCMYYY